MNQALSLGLLPMDKGISNENRYGL